MSSEEFEIVYRRHAASVLGYARRCVGRPDIAEEIASEAFLELHRNSGKINSSQLPAWLYTVVRNRAIDYWRRHRWEAPLVDVAAGPSPLPEPAFSSEKLNQAGLSQLHKTCLILRYVEGMTREEIARITGLRETQVKGHLRYGLELLRRALSTPPSGDSR